MAKVKVEIQKADGTFLSISNRGELESLESLSQSSSSPSTTSYGVISNTGIIDISDNNKDILKMIETGEIDPSNTVINIYNNDKLIQKHIALDSDYDLSEVKFSIPLSNVLNNLDGLLYKGWDYKLEEVSAYDILYDVINTLFGGKVSKGAFNSMLDSQVVVNDSVETMKSYTENLLIRYAVIEYGKTYREVLDNLCTIMQARMFIDDNGELKFVSARPIFSAEDAGSVISITRKDVHTPLDRSVILKNKYDAVEMSEYNPVLQVDMGALVYTWDSSNSDNPHTSYNSSDVDKGSYASIYTYTEARATFWNGSITVPKLKNQNLYRVNKILNGVDYNDNPNIKHTVHYDLRTATTGTVYYTDTDWFFSPSYGSAKKGSGVISTFEDVSVSVGSYKASVQDDTNLKITSITDNGDSFTLSFTIMVGKTEIAMVGPDTSMSGSATYYSPTKLEVSVYGNVSEIIFEEVDSNTENIYNAKSIANVKSNKLLQTTTTLYGKKIGDVIKSSILEDFKYGIMDGKSVIFGTDLFDLSNNKITVWQNGDILKLEDVVKFTDNNSYWKVTGRKFKYDAEPLIELELIEVKPSGAGLYNINGNLIYSWNDAVNKGIIAVSNSELTSYSYSQDANVVLPKDITSIGIGAFQNKPLASIKMQDSLSSIGEQAFRNCDKLTSINIPNSVTTIGDSAFWLCDNLATVNLPQNITAIGGGTFSGCKSLKTINIPNSVTSIGNGAFSSTALNRVVIPDSVNNIGTYAFSYCSRLGEISIGTGVTAIKEGTFEGCSFDSINIPSNITTIGERAFADCGEVWSGINIENGVITIGEEAFMGTTCNWGSLKIPNSVKNIGKWAFYNIGVNTLTLGSSIERIEESAFLGGHPQADASLSGTITFPSTLKYIGENAFASQIEHSPVFKFNSTSSLEIASIAFGGTSDSLPVNITLDFRGCTIIPTIAYDAFEYIGDSKIIVPDNLYNSWISSGNWSRYTSKIIKASQV